jgi:hypothetical protein
LLDELIPKRNWRRTELYFVAGVTGFAAGVVLWYITARWVANSILWIEHRFPGAIGSRGMKAGEIALCGFQVAACLTIAFYVARALIS